MKLKLKIAIAVLILLILSLIGAAGYIYTRKQPETSESASPPKSSTSLPDSPSPSPPELPTNMQLLYFNYASCDGTYTFLYEPTGSGTYVYQKNDNTRLIIWDPNMKGVMCISLNLRGSFGSRTIVDKSEQVVDGKSALWQDV